MSLNELRKQIAKEKAKQKKIRLARMKVDEKAKLKRQLFRLKHGEKIKKLKRVRKRFSKIGSGFQKQRKSKKGVGGFLQRIADAQA